MYACYPIFEQEEVHLNASLKPPCKEKHGIHQESWLIEEQTLPFANVSTWWVWECASCLQAWANASDAQAPCSRRTPRLLAWVKRRNISTGPWLKTHRDRCPTRCASYLLMLYIWYIVHTIHTLHYITYLTLLCLAIAYLAIPDHTRP